MIKFNHFYDFHLFGFSGPSWTTHAPPPGLHPQIRPNSQTTEPHTLTESKYARHPFYASFDQNLCMDVILKKKEKKNLLCV